MSIQHITHDTTCRATTNSCYSDSQDTSTGAAVCCCHCSQRLPPLQTSETRKSRKPAMWSEIQSLFRSKKKNSRCFDCDCDVLQFVWPRYAKINCRNMSKPPFFVSFQISMAVADTVATNHLSLDAAVTVTCRVHVLECACSMGFVWALPRVPVSCFCSINDGF